MNEMRENLPATPAIIPPTHALTPMGNIFRDIARERIRQENLALEGRFKFTAANLGLLNTERLPILTEELGEIAREVLNQPDSGMMPVDVEDKFDHRKAGGQSDSGTRDSLRKELVQLAAIAVAWIEALDSAHGSSARPSPTSEPASPEAPPSAA